MSNAYIHPFFCRKLIVLVDHNHYVSLNNRLNADLNFVSWTILSFAFHDNLLHSRLNSKWRRQLQSCRAGQHESP